MAFPIKELLSTVIIIAVLIFVYVENRPPEHCILNTQETRATLSAAGVSISDTKKGGNEICFRSKNEQLVRELAEMSNAAFLEIQLTELENKRVFWENFWSTYGWFILVGAFLLAALAIIMFFRRDYYDGF